MMNKIHEIAKTLCEHYILLPRISVKDGKLGAALFLTSFSKFSGIQKYNDIAYEIIGGVLDEVNNDYTSDTLGREMADLGIFLCYVKNHQLMDLPSGQLLHDLDVIADDFANKNIEGRDFDPITGFLAQGYYFLNRDTKVSRNALMRIVKAIKFISYEDTEGHLFWRSPKFSNGGIYTGITHGSCAVIQFLLKVGLKYKLDPLIKKMLTKSIDFLLKHSLDFNEHDFYFPTKLGEELVKTPIEWCYGDLSIGYTILNAGFSLENTEYKNTGIEILKNTISRKSADNYIDDGSLSYGSSGIAMVIKKALLISDSGLLKTAYADFIDKTIKQAKYENEFAGYRAFFYKESKEINLGLMTGIAGIGLALLAHKDERYLPFTELLYL